MTSDPVPAGINRRRSFSVNQNLISRFWSRVDKKGPDECWHWNASHRNGYGAIKHEKRVLSAHRVAYVLTYGDPGDELLVAHKCDNKSCCNPAHLEAITPGKNNRDARDRVAFHNNAGEHAPNAELTDDIAREIVRLHREHGWSGKQICQHLGLSVHQKTVSMVYRGKTWRHATGL